MLQNPQNTTEDDLIAGYGFAIKVACADADRSLGFTWHDRMDFFGDYFRDALIDHARHPGKYSDAVHAVRAWQRFALANWVEASRRRIRTWNCEIGYLLDCRKENESPSRLELDEAEEALLEECPEQLKEFVKLSLIGASCHRIKRKMRIGDNQLKAYKKHTALWMLGQYSDHLARIEITHTPGRHNVLKTA